MGAVSPNLGHDLFVWRNPPPLDPLGGLPNSIELGEGPSQLSRVLSSWDHVRMKYGPFPSSSSPPSLKQGCQSGLKNLQSKGKLIQKTN